MVGREMWKYSAGPVPHVISISGERSRDMEGCRICEWVPHWRGFMSISLVHFQGHKSQASLTSALVSPNVKHASLGPSESITKMASRSVQPFLHSSRHTVVRDVGAWPTPQNYPFPCGYLNPHLTCFLGSTESAPQMASLSGQPFMHSSWQTVPIFYNGTEPQFPPKLLLPMGIWTAI